MYWKKFTLTNGNVIQHVRFSVYIFAGRKAGKTLEFIDEMRLVIIPMFLRKITPMNHLMGFNFQDRLLETHDF